MIFLQFGHFVIIPSGTSVTVISEGIVAYFLFFDFLKISLILNGKPPVRAKVYGYIRADPCLTKYSKCSLPMPPIVV